MSHEQLKEHCANGCVWIDVRGPEEHAAHSLSVEHLLCPDTNSLIEKTREAAPDLATPIVVFCASGGRATRAVSVSRYVGGARTTIHHELILVPQTLQSEGYTNVINGGGISHIQDIAESS
jgi:rhodanese-related sulfurtransferase